MGHAGDAWFVLEFKRDEAAIGDEATKPARVRLLESIHSKPDIDGLSRRGHFVVFPCSGARLATIVRELPVHVVCCNRPHATDASG